MTKFNTLALATIATVFAACGSLPAVAGPVDLTTVPMVSTAALPTASVQPRA